jgi:hypothetical protein
MKRRIKLVLILLTVTLGLQAQIPVEIFVGHERTTFDLMFFRYFKNREGETTPFLFFSRERAVIDYRQTETTYLPQFGFTEAVSWNHRALKGFAPVVVGQVLNRGVYGKTGVQYVFLRKTFTFFGWTVVELNDRPDIDVFALMRWTPTIGARLQGYLQLESLNVLPTDTATPYAFTQRLRLGVKLREWQFGGASDFTQSGRNETFNTIQNIGAFMRYEF